MSRKIVEENYESYVLGALPEAERDEFEAHLADYPDEFAEFVEAADTMALFAMALDRTPVPDRVLKTLLSRVEADMGYEADSGRQQQAVQVHDDAGSGLFARVGTLLAGRWAHPAMGMAVVAILLLVAGGLWLDNRLGSVEQSASDMQKVDEMLAAVIEGQTELASQVEAGAASDGQIMDMVKEQRDLAYMEANPDRLVSMLRPADAAAKVRGMMVTSSDGRDCRGVVVVDHRLEVGSASLAVDQEGRIEQQRAHGRCSTCARRRRSKMSDIHWVSGTDRARRSFTSRPDPLDSGTIRATARPCRLTVKSSP